METTLEITESLRRRLESASQDEGVSMSEFVRDAIEARLALKANEIEERARGEEQSNALRSIFGMWQDRGVSTEEYMQELREERP